MKKLLYLITILILLCTSCKTKQTLQEYSMQSDSTKTECSTAKEISKEENSSSSLMAACDTMSLSLVQEEFTIKFDSLGKPTEFHGTKKKWMKISKYEKSTSQEQQIKANKLSCDSNYIFADIVQSQYKKLPQVSDVQLSTNLLEVWPTAITFKEMQPILGYTRKRKQKNSLRY